MALLFHSDIDRADWWVPELKRRLPDMDIRVGPDFGAREEIEFALVWRPPAGLLANCPNLKAIFSLGAGVDHLFADPDLPTGVPIARVVDEHLTREIVEYGLACILGAHRRFPDYAAQQAAGEWRMLGQRRAIDTHIWLLGVGVLGSALARACTGFGFHVHGWARTRPVTQIVPGIEIHHGPEGLGSVLAAAQILVCLLPLTPQTAGILDRSAFERMPKGAWVINIARGEHIVDADLIAALDGGHLSGAFLDVFVQEPLPADHPYWHHPKIAVTPHIAAVTDPRNVADQIVENINKAIIGAPLVNQVDPARGY